MTPLAKLAAEWSVTNRSWWQSSGYAQSLAPFPDRVKCFDVTQVLELATALAQEAAQRERIAEAVAFLPAPVTWIEWRYPDVAKGDPLKVEGVFLRQKDQTHAAQVSVLGMEVKGGESFVAVPLADLPLLAEADPDGVALDSVLALQEQEAQPRDGSPKIQVSKAHLGDLLEEQHRRAYLVYAMLSLINSPKVVSRLERAPPKRLGKMLGRKDRKPLELLPWHEIRLDITPPAEAAGTDGASRLTGPKALHWCRQHLRIRLGKLEMVRGHFRGDASAGIAQSHYAVTRLQ